MIELSARKEIAAHIPGIVGGQKGQQRGDAFGVPQTGAGILEIEGLAERLS